MTITDKLLEQYFDIKEERYDKNGSLLSIKYSTDYEVIENIIVTINLETKRVRIQGNVLIELLQTINDKCKDLGF